jgi:hypothetical protein
MSHDGPVIFSAFGMNEGDLYARFGVRWVLVELGRQPSWVPLHRAAWAHRRLELTVRWAGRTLRLYRLP